MVKYGLGVNLEAIIGKGSLEVVVFELVSWAEARGQFEQLLQAALDARPGNDALRIFAEHYQTAPFLKVPSASSAHQSPSTTSTPPPHPVRNQVFVSYSHKDRRWLDMLHTHLKPLTRGNTIDVWDDTRIKPGQKWRDAIESALAQAKVAVLLVSPDFLASDFIDKHELPALLEAAEKEGLVVLWVPVRPSSYRRSPIAQFQAASEPGRPLSGLEASKRDAVLVEIADKIDQTVNPKP
jgi:hypothetical protein